MTLILSCYCLFYSISHAIYQAKLTAGKLFKSLFDLIVVNAILATLIKQIEQSGRTTKGVKDFLLTFIHFVNGHMYLFEVGIILFLSGMYPRNLLNVQLKKKLKLT